MEGRRGALTVALDDKLLVARRWTRWPMQYDPKYGGFGYSARSASGRNFPSRATWSFCSTACGEREKTSKAKEMLVGTLEKMAQGGIRDHLGGGFHRYSIDRYWHDSAFRKDALRQRPARQRLCPGVRADAAATTFAASPSSCATSSCAR